MVMTQMKTIDGHYIKNTTTIDGTFVTITGFKNQQGKEPFSIGKQFLCKKEPENAYDNEAIKILNCCGETLGYIANSVHTKANGTFSAGRIYDKVGECFVIEVCFSTDTKIICKIEKFQILEEEWINEFYKEDIDK